MKTRLLTMLLVLSSVSVFASPPAGHPKWTPEVQAERMQAHERKMRLMYVVSISEALDLNEKDALKLAEKLKAVEEKRRPLRQSMGEAIQALKDASEGDATALTSVDANVQKVLDGRSAMAAFDKELFGSLAQGYSPQQRAKLALVLGRLSNEGRGFKAHHEGRGSRFNR